MSLLAGTKLGPYVIESPAGVGGMGEVYKAKDTRLDRTVAIKVLSSQIVANADIKLRFEREAKAISSLNHPNICTLYDIGHDNGTDYLVMEYLDGETLSSRLAKGALPLPEILLIASQIADALDKAHRKGLIHRDLKPANIMLTKTGAKLMDFGLAKIQIESGIVAGMSGITRTSTPLTGEGTIVGTLQYMSPEQLEGKEADIRSDIFSFGAIMYEMAVGKRAFDGTSQASLIAAILKENPRPISDIQPMSPPMLDRVIRQCLEKDPDHRWQSAGDLKRALQWITDGGSQVGIPVQVSVRRKSRERFLWIAVAVLGLIAFGLITLELTRKTPQPTVARFTIMPGSKLSAVTWPRLSPDGTMLAFSAADSLGKRGIWIRPINSLESRFLVNTSNTSYPFWSPDSKQLAYFEGKQLKKISITGGLTQLVCEAALGSDGSWGSTGIILFDANTGDSVRQVPASGGTPTAATRIERGENENTNAWPWFLPDGEHFLYLGYFDSSATSYMLRVGSLHSMESSKLIVVESRVEYHNGYLLYTKNNTLLAQPFDAKALQITGEAVPLVSGVSSSQVDRPLFSAANDGTLIYETGASGDKLNLVWLDRKGDSLGTAGQADRYLSFSLSPDGSQLAYDVNADGTTIDIWVRDLKRNIASRLTFGPKQNVWPIFTPDGSKIVYATNSAGQYFRSAQRNANGTGVEEPLAASDSTHLFVTDIFRDGQTMLLVSIKSQTDLWTLSMPDKKVAPLLNTALNETRAVFSPNGRYYAYVSNETGTGEVFVREFGPTGGKWQVTTGGTRGVQWSADGKELFYTTPTFEFWAVPVSFEHGFNLGVPVKLFSHPFYFSFTTSLIPFRVTPDGQRFLVMAPAADGGGNEIVVVQNWAEELKK